MILQACPDWEQRLARTVHASRQLPYRIGQHDCCLFAGNILYAMTGTDPMPEFRGRYHTARQAVEILRRYGGLENILRKKFGSPCDWRHGCRGDLVLYRRNTLGVCLGARAAIPERSGGLCFIPMDKMQKVFKWRPQ